MGHVHGQFLHEVVKAQHVLNWQQRRMVEFDVVEG